MTMTPIAEIATLKFYGWQGDMMGLQPVMESWSQLGDVGSGSQTLHYRAPISNIVTTGLYTGNTQANADIETIRLLPNMVVRVKDDWGTIWPSVLIHGPISYRKIACTGLCDKGIVVVRIECVWLLEVQPSSINDYDNILVPA